MTQFNPPPDDRPAGIAQSVRPPVKPWSTAAIVGFVCSLLGCLGITAILGLIFGIVGVVRSSGGRKRGFGLAIAAIPISLFTGALSVFLLMLYAVGYTIAPVLTALGPVLKADMPLSPTVVAEFRAVCSDEFNAEVTDERINAWLDAVRRQQGRLGDQLTFEKMDLEEFGQDWIKTIRIAGKFINGQADIRVSLSSPSFWRLTIEDIDIGGVSIRESAKPGDERLLAP